MSSPSQTSVASSSDNRALAAPKLLASITSLRFTQLFDNGPSKCPTSTSRKSMRGVRRLRKVNDWPNFKPIDPNSIYCKVLTEPEQIETIVQSMSDLFVVHTTHCLLDIIKFVIDVAGFQNIDLHNRTDSNLIAMLVNHRKYPELSEAECHRTGKYLFDTIRSNHWATPLQEAVYKFVERLIERFHKDGHLYDKQFSIIIFKTLSEMAKCIENRAIRNTGVVIGLKMITFISEILLSTTHLSIAIKDRLDRVQSDEDSEDELHNELTLYEEHLNVLHKAIQYLLSHVFKTNCNLWCSKLSGMKVLCAMEINHWLCLYPKYFFEHKVHMNLIELIEDESSYVRRAALDTCLSLLHSEVIMNECNEIVPHLFTIACKRYQDINQQVAIVAITICKRLLESYQQLIPKEVFQAMLVYPYNVNYIIAKASAEFVVDYFHMKTANDRGAFLKLFVEYTVERERPQKNMVLIDSFIDTSNELYDWKTIVDMLFDEHKRYKLEPHEEACLLDLMYETLRQTIAGQCPLKRKNPPKRTINAKLVVHMHEVLIQRVPMLINKYQYEAENVAKLLDMVELLDSKQTASIRFEKPMNTLFKVLFALFARNGDEKYLERVCKTLHHFSSKEGSPFAVIIRRFVDDTSKQLYEEFISFQLNDVPSIVRLSDADSVKAEDLLKHLSALYANNDLNGLVEWSNIYFDFRTIETNELLRAVQIAKHSLVCCKWWLIWSLRKLMRRGGRRLFNDPASLSDKFRCYLKQSYDLLMGTVEAIKYDCFVDITDVLILHEEEIFRFHHPNTFLTFEKVDANKLVEYLNEYVFKNMQRISHDLRLRATLKFIKVAFYMRPTYLVFILQYYQSHRQEYEIAFSELFNSCKQVYPKMIPIFLILTIEEVYKQLPEGANHSEINKLRYLVVEFSAYVGKDQDVLMEMLLLGIRYAAKAQKLFLYLGYLIDNLTVANRTNILNFTKSTLLNNKDEITIDYPYVQRFVQMLQSRKTRQRAVLSPSEASDTAPEEDE